MDERKTGYSPEGAEEISSLVGTIAASLDKDPLQRQGRGIQETNPGCSELYPWGRCLDGGCVHAGPRQEEPPGCHRETKLLGRCRVTVHGGEDRFGAS